MKKPLLSVCVLTYNHSKYVRECLDTILMQQVDVPWQIIVADDCSTDNTVAILQEYKAKHPDLIHLMLRDKNVGPERNWLDLMAYPHSKYVLYTEGDDYFTDSTKLQRQVDYLQAHDDAALCFHPVQVTYAGQPKASEVFPSPEQRFNKQSLRFDDLLKANFMQTNSVMYRWQFNNTDIRDIWPKGIIPGDWLLHLLHAQTGKIGFINRVMSVYRRHPGSLWWNSHKNIDQIWKKYGVGHVGFYVAALDLCGDNKAWRAIMENALYKLLDTLAATDAKYRTDILAQVTARYPEAITAYAAHQHALIIKLQQEAVAAERLQQDAEQQYRQTIAHRDEELRVIKTSKFWRLRNRVAGLVGRDQV
jgi:glycosyltransferase involved in cell wall biosynthesis